MTNTNEKDPRELGSSIPDKGVEESNLDDTQKDAADRKPDEGKKETQQPIHTVGRKRLQAPNITPEVIGQWKAYIWRAILEAIHISYNTIDMYILVKEWNTRNNPRIPELELDEIIRSTLDRWGIGFYRLESPYEKRRREKGDTAS